MTPFDQLAEYYGPTGRGSSTKCLHCAGGKLLLVNKTYPNGLVASESGTCQQCRGVGYVIDTDNPFFKALWETRYEVVYIGHEWSSPARREIDRGFSRRPQAEATLNLLEIPVMVRFELSSTGMVAHVQMAPTALEHSGYGATRTEALCAALLNSLCGGKGFVVSKKAPA